MNGRIFTLTTLLILFTLLPAASQAEEPAYSRLLPIIIAPPGHIFVADEQSLHTAVEIANDAGQMPRIELTADIQLTGPLPTLYNPGCGIAIIDGRDHTLDGDRLGTVLTIGPGTEVIVEQLTITKGSGTGGDYKECGGAIYSEGFLTLRQVRLHHNWARFGGAICITSSHPPAARLTLQDSTLDHNIAYTHGGALYTSAHNATAWADNDRVQVTIDDSLLQFNNATNSGGAVAAYAATGAVLSLEIADSTLSDNHVDRYTGGAISSSTYDGYIGTDIIRSTIAFNSATNTGGFYQEGSSTGGGKAAASIRNSTFSGNTARTIGGAISNVDFDYIFPLDTSEPSGVIGGADLAIYFSTITENQAERGSGVYNDGRLYVVGTIIAGNEEPGGDCWNPLQSGGYNLGSDGSCFFDKPPSDLQYGDADLQPLALNPPGSTATHALGQDSDALDRIPPGYLKCDFADGTDQRGVPRPQPPGGLCDIGAHENSQ